MARLRHHGQATSEEDGFTFTELLVSVTVLALIAVPVLAMLMHSYGYTVSAGRRTVAVNLCRERLEELRAAGSSRCLALFEEGRHRCEIAGEGDPLPEVFAPYRRETVLEKKRVTPAPGSEAEYLRVTVAVYYGRGSGGEGSVVLESNLGGG